MINQLEIFEQGEVQKTNIALTFFAFGGGQDGTAILYKIIHDPEYRKKYAPGRLLVVMADTGSEHMKTYLHVAKVQTLCAKHGIEFHFLTGDMGYHRNGWEYGLKSQYQSKNVIGMLGGRQLCTDHLKIKPLDRFLSAWLVENYDLKSSRMIHTAIYDFVRNHGRIRLILGFGAKEGRDTKSGKLDPVWKKRCVDRCYPLVEMGWDRKECQEYILSLGYELPPPSNCTICFYMSKQELVWLDRFMPDEFIAWVALEAAKIAHNTHREKNNGAGGSKKLLPQRLEEAKKEFRHWTDKELDDYKMSHGHCTKSTY